MGVKGLWRLLMPIGRRISIETLEGKILAIDASIWLTQFLKAMRDPDTGQVRPAAHLIGFIRRLCKLRYQGIRPVLVFDGATPEIKQREIRDRRRRREQFSITDSQDQIQRMAKRLLSQQLQKKDGSKLSIIVNNKNFNNKNNDNKNKEQGGITTATTSYAPGFYDPQMEEEEKKREEEEEESSEPLQPSPPKSSSLEDKQKQSSEDNNDEKDIIDLLNDDEAERYAQEAQQQQSDWDNIAIVNQDSSETREGDNSNKNNDIRRYTRPKKKRKFNIDYVASLPSTERKDAVENAQRSRRLESRREFMQVAYDMENFGQCQLRNFLKSSKLNRNIQKMAREAAINDGVDTISASDRTHKIIFTKDKNDDCKKSERNRKIRQLQEQAKQKGLSLLNEDDETSSSSSSDDDEEEDVRDKDSSNDNVFSEDDNDEDVGTKWAGKYNRNGGKNGTKRRGRKTGVTHRYGIDDDDDDDDNNIDWEDASSPSTSKGAGASRRRAIVDDDDGYYKSDDGDEEDEEEEEEQGGFFRKAMAGMDSTTTVAFHSAENNNNNSSKKSRIQKRRKFIDDDAKLAQELQDRDLAQALQDDDIQGDGARRGGGSGFFPSSSSSSSQPVKMKNSSKNLKRRRQTISINDSDDDEEKFDGGGGGFIIEKANATPTTAQQPKNTGIGEGDEQQDEADEGGGGFLPPPAGSSSEKAVASRQTLNVEEEDDSDEGDGGGFLPPGYESDLKQVSFVSRPIRDAANKEEGDESLNIKPAAHPTPVINIDDDDDSVDEGGRGFIPSSGINTKAAVTKGPLDIDNPNDSTHTANDAAIAQQLQDEEFAQHLQQTEYSSDGDSGGGFMTQQDHDGGEESSSFAVAAIQHGVTQKQGPLTQEQHIGTVAAQNSRANQIRLRDGMDLATDSRHNHENSRENVAGTGDMNGVSDEDEDLDWEDGDAEEEDADQSRATASEVILDIPMKGQGAIAKEQSTTIVGMTHGAFVSETGKRVVPSKETRPLGTEPMKTDDSDYDCDDIEWEDGHDQEQQGSVEVAPTSFRKRDIYSSSSPPCFPRERSIDSSREKSTDYSEEGGNDKVADDTGIDDTWGGDFSSSNSKTKDLAAALEHAQATASHLTNWAGRAFRRAVAQHAEENGLSVPEAAKPKAATIGGMNKAMQTKEDRPNANETILPTRNESSQQSLKSNSNRRRAGESQASISDQLDGEATLRSLTQYQEEWKKERNQQERDMDTVTDEMRAEVMQLLHLFGIPYVEAPAEAESQCVQLEKLGLVNGVVTEDSDAFVFGAQTVYKNIFEDKKYVEVYQAKDAEREMNLTHDALVALAMLLGGDYTEGVKGVGIVNGMEILDAFDVADGLQAGLVRFRDWLNGFDPTDIIPIQKGREDGSKERDFHKKHYTARARWVAPKHFPDPKVLNAYLNPVVDTSDDRFTWGVPDLEKLVVFCNRHVGWTTTETKHVLEPVIERVESNRSMQQTRIDSFMRYEDGIKFASIRSKRLRDVLGKVKDTKSSATKQKQEQESKSKSKHFKKK